LDVAGPQQSSHLIARLKKTCSAAIQTNDTGVTGNGRGFPLVAFAVLLIWTELISARRIKFRSIALLPV
jgi:hypothetical protein